jgi:hypothetical protein
MKYTQYIPKSQESFTHSETGSPWDIKQNWPKYNLSMAYYHLNNYHREQRKNTEVFKKDKASRV